MNADRLRAQWPDGMTAFVATDHAAVRWLTGLAGEGRDEGRPLNELD